MMEPGLEKLARPVAVGGRRVSPRLHLAPMTFLGHVAFRQLLAELGGVGLMFTEMCSAKALLTEVPERSAYFRWRPEELGRLVCQIFGREPETMAAAAERIEAEGFFGVDLNFGCAASRIYRRDCGSALLLEPARAAAIVAAVRGAVRIPLTVKYRLGPEGGTAAAVEMARRFEDAGADALTFHPRAAPDRRSRPARWEAIGRVKAAVGIPVFGNGDVFDERDCARMLAQTGCDGVALGRLAIARPWVFAAWTEGRPPPAGVHRRTALRMIELLGRHFAPKAALQRWRRFAGYFAANFKFGNSFYNRARNAADLASAARAVEEFFATSQPLCARPNLNFLL